MSAAAVLDTDVVSILFREDSRAPFYQRATHGFERVISFMTVAELARWTLRDGWGSEKSERLDAFLHDFAVLDSDHELSIRWALVTQNRRRIGRPIGCADAWVAATALELACPLITHNARDFELIPDLDVVTAPPA